MSIIETITDVNNSFLSRRELTCNFAGLGGKLKTLEAADMITKEFKLDDKVVIPMRLRTQVGKSLITGTFYVYDDEGLAKKYINPTIFLRLERAKAKLAEADAAAKEAEETPTEVKADAPTEETPTEVKADAPTEETPTEVKADAPTEETKKEEKSE